MLHNLNKAQQLMYLIPKRIKTQDKHKSLTLTTLEKGWAHLATIAMDKKRVKHSKIVSQSEKLLVAHSEPHEPQIFK